MDHKFNFNGKNVTLTGEDIDDIMCSALEGGVSYWCSKAVIVGSYKGDYASEQISRGGSLHLYDIEDNKTPFELDLEAFLKGFQLWLGNGGDIYGAVQEDGTVDCGMIDGPAADSIVQYALFGQLVYG